MRKSILLSAITAGFLANDSIVDVSPDMVASALVKVESEAYNVEYEDITFTDILPIIDLNDKTATSFAYYYLTKAGKAQLSKPDGSIAWVDSFLKMKQAPLHDGNTGYKYTLKELARVNKMGTGLDQIKPETAIQASLELAQEIAFFGDEERDIVGFFNNPDVPQVSPLVGVGGNTWALKTPKEILADVNYIFATAFKTTKQKEFKVGSKTSRLLLPTDKFSHIANTPLHENSDKTILDFIAEKSVYISSKEHVVPTPHLADDTIRIYQKDKKKVAFYWGHMIDFKNPQFIDLDMRVPADFAIGGTVTRNPLSQWDMVGV